MTIAFVNGASGSDDLLGSGPINVVLPGNLAGALLVVMASSDSPTNYSNIDTITDTSGNSYTGITGAGSLYSYQRLDMWYAKNIAASGSNTITVNFTDFGAPPGSTTYTKRVTVLQYSGIDTVAPLLNSKTDYGSFGLVYPLPPGPWTCGITPGFPAPTIPAGSLIVAAFTFGTFPGAGFLPTPTATGGGADRVIDITKNFTTNFVVPGWNVIRIADGKLAKITSLELTGKTSGIATAGTITTKLIDSTKNFVALGVSPGDYIIFPILLYAQINTITTTFSSNDTLNLWWPIPGLAPGVSYKISDYAPAAGNDPADTLIYTPSGSTPVFAPGDQYWVPAVTTTALTPKVGWTLRTTVDILGTEDRIWPGGPVGFSDVEMITADFPNYIGTWASFAPGPEVGPTMEQLMRHGKWFGSGHFQGCWLGWR